MFFEHGTGRRSKHRIVGSQCALRVEHDSKIPYELWLHRRCLVYYGPGCQVLYRRPGAYPLNVTSIPTKAVWPYLNSGVSACSTRFEVRWSARLLCGQQRNTSDCRAPAQPVKAGTGLSESIWAQPAAYSERLKVRAQGDCGGGSPGPSGFRCSMAPWSPPTDPAYFNLVAACTAKTVIRNPTPDVNTVRPYPGLGQIFSLQNVADSTYHSFKPRCAARRALSRSAVLIPTATRLTILPTAPTQPL